MNKEVLKKKGRKEGRKKISTSRKIGTRKIADTSPPQRYFEGRLQFFRLGDKPPAEQT